MLTHTQKESVMTIAGKEILRVKGVVRVLTDAEGHVLQFAGIQDEATHVQT